MKKYIKDKLHSHGVMVKKLWAVCLILIGINNVIVGISKYFKADSDRKKIFYRLLIELYMHIKMTRFCNLILSFLVIRLYYKIFGDNNLMM